MDRSATNRDGHDEYGLECKVDVYECYWDGWMLTVPTDDNDELISLEEKEALNEFLLKL
jgi:hypothetical protein